MLTDRHGQPSIHLEAHPAKSAHAIACTQDVVAFTHTEGGFDDRGQLPEEDSLAHRRQVACIGDLLKIRPSCGVARRGAEKGMMTASGWFPSAPTPAIEYHVMAAKFLELAFRDSVRKAQEHYW